MFSYSGNAEANLLHLPQSVPNILPFREIVRSFPVVYFGLLAYKTAHMPDPQEHGPLIRKMLISTVYSLRDDSRTFSMSQNYHTKAEIFIRR